MSTASRVPPLDASRHEREAHGVESAARRAWADSAWDRRWTFWVRLSWAHPVSEYAAQRHVAQWAARVRRRVPGSAVMVGVHHDTDRRHAHCLVFIPRRGAPPARSAVEWCRGVCQTWHQTLWRHGLLWLDRFTPGPSASQRHGAPVYLARDPGSVMRFGTAPRYQPRRARR